MKEFATVESTQGEFAIVTVKRSTACGDSCETCPSRCNTRSNKIKVRNPIGAVLGDRVVIEMETSKVLKSAFLVYILPLIMFFVGYIIGEVYKMSETKSVICALSLFTLTYIILSLIDRVRKYNCTTSIVEVVER